MSFGRPAIGTTLTRYTRHYKPKTSERFHLISTHSKLGVKAFMIRSVSLCQSVVQYFFGFKDTQSIHG